MKRTTNSLIPLLATLLTLTACNKKSDGDSATPEDGAAAADEAPKPQEPDVPQEPDPPDIAQGRKAYILGQYEQVTDKLPTVYGDLKERSQYRASGLAGGWLALALAKDVVENAEEPATHAVAMGDRTLDPEVVAVAKMAHGAYLLGMEDFDAAVDAFGAATEASGEDRVLAFVLHGEALLGRAYGGGDSTDLKNPQDLDGARQSYAQASKLAAGKPLGDALAGRAEEGLAAVAKYKGERDQICTHARAASEKYEAAGASDFLKEGPQMLARDARCK